MKLKCEQHTPAMHKRVLAAYRARYGVRKVQAHYEHGQWWITQPSTGAAWSVCDAEGSGSTQGFCFEQVSQGDE